MPASRQVILVGLVWILYVFQLLVCLYDFLLKRFLESDYTLHYFVVACRHDLGGKDACILGRVKSDRGDRYSGGHLEDRQNGIETLEGCFDGHSYHRQRGH